MTTLTTLSVALVVFFVLGFADSQDITFNLIVLGNVFSSTGLAVKYGSQIGLAFLK